MKRPRDGRIYQGHFWATALQTRSRSNGHERKNRRVLFPVWSVPRCYQQETRLQLSQFYTGVSPLLKSVTRKRLVKTLQAGKGLAGAVVICELWKLTVAVKSLGLTSRVHKWSLNPFSNPNPVYTHARTT
jgi:hypothetical protein